MTHLSDRKPLEKSGSKYSIVLMMIKTPKMTAIKT
jgi:hypothetical protein